MIKYAQLYVAPAVEGWVQEECNITLILAHMKRIRERNSLDGH